MGIDCMGMGGNGNVKSHSRRSLARSEQVKVADMLWVSCR